MDKYKENKDISMNESFKSYAKVRKYCGKEVSLVFVRDHKNSKLNLAIESKRRVVETRMNMDDIPIPDMI